MSPEWASILRDRPTVTCFTPQSPRHRRHQAEKRLRFRSATKHRLRPDDHADGNGQRRSGSERYANGSVTFYDGATALGTLSLNNGTATLPVNDLPVGMDGVTASYSGDSLFDRVHPPAVNVTVEKDGTVVSIASSANPAAVGQEVAFTAVAMA